MLQTAWLMVLHHFHSSWSTSICDPKRGITRIRRPLKNIATFHKVNHLNGQAWTYGAISKFMTNYHTNQEHIRVLAPRRRDDSDVAIRMCVLIASDSSWSTSIYNPKTGITRMRVHSPTPKRLLPIKGEHLGRIISKNELDILRLFTFETIQLIPKTLIMIE